MVNCPAPSALLILPPFRRIDYSERLKIEVSMRPAYPARPAFVPPSPQVILMKIGMLAVATSLGLMCVSPVSATLGEDLASVRADAAHLNATLHTAENSSYSIVELRLHRLMPTRSQDRHRDDLTSLGLGSPMGVGQEPGHFL